VLDELRAVTSSNAVDKSRVELAQDEDQLRELATMWAKRDVSTTEYLTARKEIEGRMATSRKVVRAAIPGTVRRLVGEDVAEVWSTYGPAQRREVARIVFRDGVEVLPGDAASRGRFDPRRLRPLSI
jgi:site-specific DNA recombinase